MVNTPRIDQLVHRIVSMKHLFVFINTLQINAFEALESLLGSTPQSKQWKVQVYMDPESATKKCNNPGCDWNSGILGGGVDPNDCTFWPSPCVSIM